MCAVLVIGILHKVNIVFFLDGINNEDWTITVPSLNPGKQISLEKRNFLRYFWQVQEFSNDKTIFETLITDSGGTKPTANSSTKRR